MESLIIILFGIVEAIVQVGKMLFSKSMESVHYVVFVLGAFVAWFFGFDVFALLQVEPAVTNKIALLVVNLFLAGVLFVRYSGAANDLLTWVNGLRNK